MMSLLDLIVEQEELLKQLDKVINDREQHREQLLSCDSACSAECEAGIFDAAKEAQDTSSAAASEEAAPKQEGAAAAAASMPNQSQGKGKASRPQLRKRLPRKCKSSAIQISLVLLVICCAGTPAAAKGGSGPVGFNNPARKVVQASALAKGVPKIGKPKVSRGILNSVFNRENANGIMKGLESSANFFDLVKTAVEKFKAKGDNIEQELKDHELFECRPRNGGLCYSGCARTQDYKQKWCHTTSTLSSGAWDVCDCILRPVMRRWMEANKAKILAVDAARVAAGEEAEADLYTLWIIIATLAAVMVVAIISFISRCAYNYRFNNKKQTEVKRERQQQPLDNLRGQAPRLDQPAMILGMDRTRSLANLNPTTQDNPLLTRPPQAKSMINLTKVGPPKHVTFEDTTAMTATPPNDPEVGREE